jgi:hypothetical protein
MRTDATIQDLTEHKLNAAEKRAFLGSLWKLTVKHERLPGLVAITENIDFSAPIQPLTSGSGLENASFAVRRGFLLEVDVLGTPPTFTRCLPLFARCLILLNFRAVVFRLLRSFIQLRISLIESRLASPSRLRRLPTHQFQREVLTIAQITLSQIWCLLRSRMP